MKKYIEIARTLLSEICQVTAVGSHLKQCK